MTAELTVRDGQDELDVLALKPRTLAQVSVSVVFAIADKPIPDVDAVVAVRAQVANLKKSGCKQLNGEWLAASSQLPGGGSH